MRIIALRAENVKRLRAVEITPEGDVVVIAGRNAQGKSSVLDAIWLALAGADGAKETTRPIRDGEKQAQVELDLGDLLVTRRWTQSGTTLHVASKDGARYSSPQKMLDGLIGKLTFDPLEFAEAPAKEQLRTLLSVVDLPFDPGELAAKRAGIYDERTEANREVKRLEALLSDVEPPPEDTPDEEVSAGKIAGDLRNAEVDERARDAVVEAEAVARVKVATLKDQLAAAEARLRELQGALEETPAVFPITELRAALEAVDATNTRVRAKKERTRLTSELRMAKGHSEGFTADLERLDASKAEALAAATMPLEGLSFDDEGVLYNGVPFAQASASERLRASIAIAMALNPEIRVIRITDGSLLDSTNLAMIAEMAAEHDFQCWIERVDETGEVGITIEDGAVAS